MKLIKMEIKFYQDKLDLIHNQDNSKSKKDGVKRMVFMKESSVYKNQKNTLKKKY